MSWILKKWKKGVISKSERWCSIKKYNCFLMLKGWGISFLRRSSRTKLIIVFLISLTASLESLKTSKIRRDQFNGWDISWNFILIQRQLTSLMKRKRFCMRIRISWMMEDWKCRWKELNLLMLNLTLISSMIWSTRRRKSQKLTITDGIIKYYSLEFINIFRFCSNHYQPSRSMMFLMFV